MVTSAFMQPLYDLGHELARYKPPGLGLDYLEFAATVEALCAEITDLDEAGKCIGYLLEDSWEMLRSDRDFPDTPKPRFELTRRTLQFAARRGTPAMPQLEKDYLKITCPGIELRFARALDWHESGSRPSPDHKPGIVLFDVADEPFAYQKSSGLPTAFVWRNAYFDTAAGERWLPAGSIVRPIYDINQMHNWNVGLHDQYQGSGLIGVPNAGAADVAFVRFSACCLPGELRAPFLQRGAAQTSKLYANLEAALSLNEQMVAERVAALMASDQFILI